MPRYAVEYHPELADDVQELGLLTTAQHGRVIRKLEERAEDFRPLRRELKGLRRIREGDKRVVYRVRGSVATIIAIGPRRDDAVYRVAVRRVGREG